MSTWEKQIRPPTNASTTVKGKAMFIAHDHTRNSVLGHTEWFQPNSTQTKINVEHAGEI